MENFTDIIYQVDYRDNTTHKWYICGIKRFKNKTYLVAKDNKRNKNKFSTINISLNRIDKEFFVDKKDAEYALKNKNIRKEYTIKFSCGHEDIVRLKPKDASNQIIELKKHLCPECRNKKSEEEGCVLIPMPYAQYMKYYRHCDTKKGSYKDDGVEKTIEVYIKK